MKTHSEDNSYSAVQVELSLANFFKYSPIAVTCDLAVINPMSGNGQGDPIYSYIRSLLGRNDLAAIQEIFSRTWQVAFEKFTDTFHSFVITLNEMMAKCTEVIKWVKTIARNTYRNWLRKELTFKQNHQLDYDEPWGETKEETKAWLEL